MMLAVFSWPHVKDMFAHTSIAISSSTQAASTPQDEQDAPPRLLAARTTYAHITVDDTVISVEDSRPVITEDDEIESSETPKPGVLPDTHADRSSHIVSHQDSPQEHAQRTHQRAVHALQNGEYATAEAILLENLGLDNSRHETRLLLANLYIRQQRTLDAESVLTEGLMHYPGDAAYARLYAQLLVAQTRYSEALHYLQAALPGATRDADYNALLAGLYQRAGLALDAIKYYQVALQLSPAKGEWWMGLGISLEQSGNSVNAYKAYQRALQYPLSPALQQYVHTRIRNLPTRPGQG